MYRTNKMSGIHAVSYTHLDVYKRQVGLFYRNLEEKLVSEDIKTRQTARDALKYGLKALMGRDL